MKPTYEGLGKAGATVEALAGWLRGLARTREGRAAVHELVRRYEFTTLRNALEAVWTRQEAARRYREWQDASNALAARLATFRRDNARLLEWHMQVAEELGRIERRLREPFASAPGRRAVAHRVWAEKLLRDAGILREHRRLILRILARAK